MFVFLLVISLGQSIPTEQLISTDPRHPITHSRDSLESWTEIDATTLTRVRKSEGSKYDRYFLKDELYNGWARQIFPNEDHRYRYSLYEDGLLMRQIAYYASEQLDADFEMKRGMNCGSARMWHADGKLYIDTFCDENGNQHGMQWRWHGNGEVARKALYESGIMIYELLYDINGVQTEKRGRVPKQ